MSEKMLPPDKIAETFLRVLQADPVKYRNFGVYWWFVKKFMKRFYSKANLYMLGDYVDETQAAMVPTHDSLEETLQEAIGTWQHNAMFNLDRADVLTPDGEVVTIFDQDAGI